MSAEDHGHTPANWTASIVALIGCFIATVGFFMPNIPVIVVGSVVALVSPFIVTIMNKVAASKDAE